jgi:hypothetical protein
VQPQQYPQYPTTGAPPMPQYPQQTAGYVPPAAYPPPYQPAYPAPSYAPQQYAPAAVPPAAPLPTGTLDGFYSQPSGGGGPSFKFNGKPIGTSYAGIVARTITNADVRAQTNNAGQVQTYKDGRPKFVLVVPMQVQPSPEFPEGVAGWWVKGQARDELARAMAEAGAPEGPPEAGAAIRVTLVGQRQVPNMNPQLLYRVEYMRPQGAAPVPQPVAAAAQQAPPAPQQTAPVMSTATGQPVVHQQQVPAPPAAPAATAGFNPEQAALFARLTGQPVG